MKRVLYTLAIFTFGTSFASWTAGNDAPQEAAARSMILKARIAILKAEMPHLEVRINQLEQGIRDLENRNLSLDRSDDPDIKSMQRGANKIEQYFKGLEQPDFDLKNPSFADNQVKARLKDRYADQLIDCLMKEINSSIRWAGQVGQEGEEDRNDGEMVVPQMNI